MLGAIFKRDVKLAFKQSSFAAVGFFLIVILSLVLSGQGDISALAVPFIWAALLLAHLLFVPFFLEDDLAYGILDLMLIEIKLPALLVLVKCFALWIGAALPLVFSISLAAFLFPLANLLPLLLSVFVGSLGLVFFNALAACLTCGLRASAWLAPLIILPLELPILIFGAQASRQNINQIWTSEAFMLLSGFVLLVLALAPAVSALALKIREGE